MQQAEDSVADTMQSPRTLQQEIEELLEAEGDATPLRFDGRTFSEPVRLRDLTFNREVSFEGAVFSQGLELMDCVFKKDVNASGASFGGSKVDFSDSRFEAMAVFRPKNVSRISLRSSVFAKGFEVALPRDAAADLDLRYVNVSGAAVVKPLDYGQPGYQGHVDAGPLEAYEMALAKESSLDISGICTPILHLGASVLNDKASIYLSEIDAGTLYFNDVRTIDKATVSLHRAQLAQARFSGTNIERFNFSNVTWPRIGKRACIFEEQELRAGKRFEKPAGEADLADMAERVTENYRQLVLNYEAKRNYELAESFHFSEMEMLRLKAANGLPRRLGALRPYLNAYWLYRVVSGYGANYGRAALVLASLLLAFALAFMFNGLQFKDGRSFDYSIASSASHPATPSVQTLAADYGTALALTLSIATLQKERPLEPAGLSGAVLSSLLVLFIPAQAALLLLALRRKFRRAGV